MKIMFAAYRKWAFKVLEDLISIWDYPSGHRWFNKFEISTILTMFNKHEINETQLKYLSVCTGENIPYEILKDNHELSDIVKHYEPELVIFCGWSWMVPSEIVNNYRCICLHPSLLPGYRGGSPLQNQIINGELTGGATLFEMREGLDDGPIISQKKFSLEGNLEEILKRLEEAGRELIGDYLWKVKRGEPINPIPQDESLATTYSRRKPSESEITEEELKTKPAKYLYNKVRMLQDPYPNAFIKCADGKKLYLVNVKAEDDK